MNQTSATPSHEQPPRPPSSPRLSYKAMGISNVFFGMLSGVGALANWSSGHGADRAILSALLALTLIVMGIWMTGKDSPRGG